MAMPQNRRMRKAMSLFTGTAVVVGTVLLTGGCARECVDDGLAQKHCPVDDDAAGSGSGGDDDGHSTGTGVNTDGDEPTESGAGGECPDLDVVLTPEIPTIQLVVDQSGSMAEDFGGVSRWDAVLNTLVDPDEGVVTRLQSAIRFGLSRYSTSDGECPHVQEMAPQLDAADEIAAELAALPLRDTPTGESLEIILDTLLEDTWDGDKFMVLATDGEPDTCAIPEPHTQNEIDETRGAAVAAVERAYGEGVRTYVVSVGTDIAQEHLQDLANAGVGNDPGDPDAPFYQALDQQALIDAFDAIINGLRECKFDLDKPLTTDQALLCELTINDVLIPYDDPDGWSLDGDMSIVLTGSACQAIQEGMVVVKMTCAC
jgi:hypothetical protein